MDVDSGKLMAVIILKEAAGTSKEQEWKLSVHYALKREVGVLSNMNHVSKTPEL